MEEATAIAAEYISSLDNLPSEVQFILRETQTLDERAAEYQARINSRQAKILAHYKNLVGANGSGEVLLTNVESLQDKILGDYEKLAAISAQKQEYAASLETLMVKHLRRLNEDLIKLQDPTGTLSSLPIPIPMESNPITHEVKSMSQTLSSLMASIPGAASIPHAASESHAEPQESRSPCMPYRNDPLLTVVII